MSVCLSVNLYGLPSNVVVTCYASKLAVNFAGMKRAVLFFRYPFSRFWEFGIYNPPTLQELKNNPRHCELLMLGEEYLKLMANAEDNF